MADGGLAGFYEGSIDLLTYTGASQEKFNQGSTDGPIIFLFLGPMVYKVIGLTGPTGGRSAPRSGADISPVEAPKAAEAARESWNGMMLGCGVR